MEVNFTTSHDFVDEFNDIDCPSWIDFVEENYNPRETDVRWFASAQPHLRTPECIIKAELMESMQKASAVDISSTPNIKQRRRQKTTINDKPPPKLFSGKLQFSSSDEDEISEMLKAHNKRVLDKIGKPNASKQSNTISSELSGPQVANDMPKLKVVPSSVSNPTVKRRSCAPLLMKNRLVKCNNGLPSSVPEKLVKSSSTVNSDKGPFKSTISPRSCELKAIAMSNSNRSIDSNYSFKPVPSEKLSQPSSTPPESVKVKSSLEQKTTKAVPFKNKSSIKSGKSSASSSTSTAKPASSVSSSSKTIANKCNMQTNSAKVSKAPVSSKPIIKSSSVSKRPNLSNSLQRKVASNSGASKIQPSTKDPLHAKKSNSIQKKVATTSVVSKIQSHAKDSMHSSKTGNRKQPTSKPQNRSTGPFGPSNAVLSIINAKTPGKNRLKTSEVKPRYSVETPSPPRTANCESSDDEDLDEFITRQLKAHNAKVEAKMIANNRIAGKAAKTSKQVSLHLGSPSRPKMKPVRHKG